MTKKKILFMAVVMILTLTLSIGLTLAYLSHSTETENKIAINKGNVKVTESFPEVSVQKMMDNDFQKEVKVTNTGTSDCFVRVYVDFSDSRIRDNNVKKIKCGSTEYLDWNDFLLNVANHSDWEYVDNAANKLDGYFYYRQVVSVGEVTAPLFTNVLIDYGTGAGDNNLDKISDFDIIVYSETVQTTEIDSDGTIYQDNQWRTAWEKFLKI